MNNTVKRLTNLGCLLLLFFLFSCSTGNKHLQKTSLRTAKGKQNTIPYSKMALKAEFIGTAIANPDWFNWGASPIEGEDGKIHIFGARWPAVEGMGGWTGPNAELAHFVSESPEGPFKYVESILTTSMLSDKSTMSAPHNPRLEKVDGKYIMLFILQNPSIGSMGMHIRMMIADKLDGPWRFAGNNEGFMVKPSDDPNHWTYRAAIGADNPAFQKIGDKYYIYYKCGTPEHMKAKYGYAVSDKLEGPYTLCDAPITDNISYLEDAQAFNCDGKYYLITTDNLGGNTGIYGDLILWESETGLDFKLADAKIAMGNIFDYWGTEADHNALRDKGGYFVRDETGKLERPAVLMQKGKPTYLYAPADVNISGGKVSESYIFKIHW